MPELHDQEIVIIQDIVGLPPTRADEARDLELLRRWRPRRPPDPKPTHRFNSNPQEAE